MNEQNGPLVLVTTTPGVFMVQSRRHVPGAFWAVQRIGIRYSCTCPARRECAHIAAVEADHPIVLTVVPDPTGEDVFAETARYTPVGGAAR